MSDVIINNIKMSDDLATALRQLGCELPLAHHPEYCGAIVDAAGRSIAAVDPNQEFVDEQAEAMPRSSSSPSTPAPNYAL